MYVANDLLQGKHGGNTNVAAQFFRINDGMPFGPYFNPPSKRRGPKKKKKKKKVNPALPNFNNAYSTSKTVN
jgi:hypothetical protein